jgi:hypothetical protein
MEPRILAHADIPPCSDILSGLTRLKHMRELHVPPQYHYLKPPFDASLVELVAALPALECLRIHAWDDELSFTRGEEDIRSLVENFSKHKLPNSLIEVDIVIGRYDASHFLGWMFSQFNGDGIHGAKLMRLKLSFSEHHFFYASDLPKHMSAMNPTRSLNSLIQLKLSLTMFIPFPQDVIPEILAGCINLQSLDISHGSNVAVESVLAALPASLQVLKYNIEIAHDGATALDKHLSRFLNEMPMNATQPRLIRIDITVVSQLVEDSTTWADGGVEFYSKQVKTQRNDPQSKLPLLLDTCAACGVQLDLTWMWTFRCSISEQSRKNAAELTYSYTGFDFNTRDNYNVFVL